MDISKIGMDERNVRPALTEIKAYLTGYDKYGLGKLIYTYVIPEWSIRAQEEVKKAAYDVYHRDCPYAYTDTKCSGQIFIRRLLDGNEESIKALDAEARKVLDKVVEICYETRKRLVRYSWVCENEQTGEVVAESKSSFGEIGNCYADMRKAAFDEIASETKYDEDFEDGMTHFYKVGIQPMRITLEKFATKYVYYVKETV